MSTIINSTEDNQHQQIDSNLTRKFLTGHRGKINEEISIRITDHINRDFYFENVLVFLKIYYNDNY